MYIGDNKSVNTTLWYAALSPSFIYLFIFYGRKRAGSLLHPVTFRRRGCTIQLLRLSRVFESIFYYKLFRFSDLTFSIIYITHYSSSDPRLSLCVHTMTEIRAGGAKGRRGKLPDMNNIQWSKSAVVRPGPEFPRPI